MSLDARLEALQARHLEVEEKLSKEMRQLSAEDVALMALKKEKLRLKDEISQLREKAA